LTSDWGYGNAYYNPYYTAPLVVESAPYNYSQPVVVNNYISSESDSSGATAQVEQPVPSPSGLSSLDEGLVAFKAGNFSSSLSSFDSSLKELPSDPVVHEVRALNLFALGQYPAAAASLNSLLSSAPGMDWTTMSSLYGDVDDYASQLKKLEQFCEINANDAASQFVLAYHYLVVGEQDSAINALKAVVKIQPKDSTAKRMLDALAPPVATSVPSAGIASDAPQPNTDLVGSWRATAGTTTIDLAITEDSKYVWKAITSGQPPVEIVGDLTAEGDAIVLANDKQGSMAGAVRSLGADKWQFTLNGSPSTDPGLSFARVGK